MNGNDKDRAPETGPRCAREAPPRTLAAQALGWWEPSTRGLVPAIHPATTYERAADGSYPSGRSYTRDENPTYEQAEALLAALEGGEQALLFASGMAAAAAVLDSLDPGAHVVAGERMYWALRGLTGAARARGPHPARPGAHRRHRSAGARGAPRRDEAGVGRDAREPDLRSHRPRGGGRDRAAGGRRRSPSTRRWPRRSTRGRSRSAAIWSSTPRPRCSTATATCSPARWCARARDELLVAHPSRARVARRGARAVRGVAAAARHAHALPARAGGEPWRAARRRGAAEHAGREPGLLSRPARSPRPPRRRAPDDGRLRRAALVPRPRRRGGGARGRLAHARDQAGDVARRGREPDRASRVDRGSGVGVARRSAATRRSGSRIPRTWSRICVRRSAGHDARSRLRACPQSSAAC